MVFPLKEGVEGPKRGVLLKEEAEGVVEEVWSLLWYDPVDEVLEFKVLEVYLIGVFDFLLGVAQVLQARLAALEVLAV